MGSLHGGNCAVWSLVSGLRVPRGGGTAFLVHCLDRDGASELRTETRPRHLDWLKALYAAAGIDGSRRHSGSKLTPHSRHE